VDTDAHSKLAPHDQPLAWTDRLSARLFALTLAAILFTEFLIFIPSVSGLRTQWLEERIAAARIAALALEAAQDQDVSDELAESLLMSAEVLGIAEIEDDMRIQVLPPAVPIEGPVRMVDLQSTTPMGRSMAAILEYFAPPGEILVVLADGSREGRIIEILLPQAPLKAGLTAFAFRIAGLSLIIALVAALLIYAVLDALVVRPMKRVTVSVEQFSRDPGSWTRRLSPTTRRDEIGRAQNALAGMEEAVADAFRQRAHLAELGSAVAKINHDLRNSLASAQLVSDVLARSDDPRVQRTAPRLERALERAIELATATLDYGKAAPRPARLQTVSVVRIISEAAEEALPSNGVRLELMIAATCEALADPDHLYRIAANLIRNAAEAMAQAGTAMPQISVSAANGALLFADNGPGLPDKARDNLFKPFASSGRVNGTGLGLVIAHELADAMGGRLELADTGASGTTFRLSLPALHA
jgi:signal transduction histidine kinase